MEQYLKMIHAEQYNGLDDDMPDHFDNWLSELDVQDLIQYADNYAKLILLSHG